MSNSEAEKAETAELSPEMQQVMARARRSFLVSMGLLVAGLAIIGFAIVFKTGGDDAGSGYQAGVLSVPANAEVISIVPSEGMFAVTYRLDGKMRLRLLNGTTGAEVSDIAVASE